MPKLFTVLFLHTEFQLLSNTEATRWQIHKFHHRQIRKILDQDVSEFGFFKYEIFQMLGVIKLGRECKKGSGVNYSLLEPGPSVKKGGLFTRGGQQ